MVVVLARVHVRAHARVLAKPHARVPAAALASGAVKAHVREPVVITLAKVMQIVKRLGFKGVTCHTLKSL